MPAWGTGYFDNDEANLCLTNLTTYQPTKDEIGHIITILSENLTKPYLEVHSCSDTMIISILIISLHTQDWIHLHPDIRNNEKLAILKFIRRNQTIWERKYHQSMGLEVLELVMKCLDVVLDRKRSECSELWYETTRYGEWKNTIGDLKIELQIIKQQQYLVPL
ncbi:uncharacterized protein J8A68_001427 [[Candida] subhashii]|uniref:Uncharacterized protein n=1 Tax=[Candida] subhashii TaxID=561895 RepID=A0A8J5R3G8_9ASCO|nr:uncharacterized protein J8A68_001427 [[Candida] subhashii]KAG7665020.1 hypothetical protein J8A68_001427 [[Candida] subhashii]